jgi:hypothetical protein
VWPFASSSTNVSVTCFSPYQRHVPTCLSPPRSIKAKVHKANKSISSTRKAAQCNQGILVDFAFVVQSFKDSERVGHFSGLHGEMCYVLSRDHFSNTIYGDAFRTKAPPIELLTNDLTPRAPDLRSIPNAFARILEGNLVAARETLTYLLWQGTQSTRRLQTRLIRMCPSSVPVETLEIRFVPCSLVSHWPLAFGRLRFIILRLDSP